MLHYNTLSLMMLNHYRVGFKLNSWKFPENVGMDVSYT